MPEAHHSATEAVNGIVDSTKLDGVRQFKLLTAVSMSVSVMLALLLLTLTQLGPTASSHTVCRWKAPVPQGLSGTSARRLELPNQEGKSI